LVRAFAQCGVAREREVGIAKREAALRLLAMQEQIYRELKARGPEAQRALLPLLDHPEPGLRRYVGYLALEFAPEEGERALSAVARSGGLPAYEARLTLEQWRSGRITFP
jgi:hypothetical protein